jgi:hypothetical protein
MEAAKAQNWAVEPQGKKSTVLYMVDFRIFGTMKVSIFWNKFNLLKFNQRPEEHAASIFSFGG